MAGSASMAVAGADVRNPYRKTPVAAAELGITESHLQYLLRARKIPPPSRDSSGHYIWTDADIEAARAALPESVRGEPAAPAKVRECEMCDQPAAPGSPWCNDCGGR